MDVQCTLALKHLQRFLQKPLTHPQAITSIHDFSASGNVIHLGSQPLLPAVHPHSEGEGFRDCLICIRPHICPAWYAALFKSCMSASFVGGIDSNLRFFCVNKSFLAIYTSVSARERCYITTTKRWSTCMSKKSKSMLLHGCDIAVKAIVDSGYFFHTLHAKVLPRVANADTVSHTVRAWNPGRVDAFHRVMNYYKTRGSDTTQCLPTVDTILGLGNLCIL